MQNSESLFEAIQLLARAPMTCISRIQVDSEIQPWVAQQSDRKTVKEQCLWEQTIPNLKTMDQQPLMLTDSVGPGLFKRIRGMVSDQLLNPFTISVHTSTKYLISNSKEIA